MSPALVYLLSAVLAFTLALALGMLSSWISRRERRNPVRTDRELLEMQRDRLAAVDLAMQGGLGYIPNHLKTYPLVLRAVELKEAGLREQAQGEELARLRAASLKLVESLLPEYEAPGYAPTARIDWRSRDHVLDALGIPRREFQEGLERARVLTFEPAAFDDGGPA